MVMIETDIMFWVVQLLSEAFATWKQEWLETLDLDQKMNLAVTRWQQRELSAAFEAFRANLVKGQKARTVSPSFGIQPYLT